LGMVLGVPWSPPLLGVWRRREGVLCAAFAAALPSSTHPGSGLTLPSWIAASSSPEGLAPPSDDVPPSPSGSAFLAPRLPCAAFLRVLVAASSSS
jgi:hypothetical protein